MYTQAFTRKSADARIGVHMRMHIHTTDIYTTYIYTHRHTVPEGLHARGLRRPYMCVYAYILHIYTHTGIHTKPQGLDARVLRRLLGVEQTDVCCFFLLARRVWRRQMCGQARGGGVWRTE